MKRKVFGKKNENLTKENAELQDVVSAFKTQAELYKEDFEQEREDRENAHNMKEEMRVECDRALHEKTTELEELRASETTLRNQLEDTIEVQDKHQFGDLVARGKELVQGIKIKRELFLLRKKNQEIT